MTNNKFIAYNLIATGVFVIIIAWTSDFAFSFKTTVPTAAKTTDIQYSLPADSPGAIQATERMPITFILGADEGPGENYYLSADRFYQNHPKEGTDLIVRHCRSLLEVRNFLAIHHDSDQLPWGKVNLVVHGNEWSGLGVPVLKGGRRTTVQTLAEAVQSGALKPLPDHVADTCTEIHIHGCAVGRNNLLLNAIGAAFGTGESIPVHSSPHFVRYESDRRTQLRSWYAFYPKSARPADEMLIRQLEQRYPKEAIDWADALKRDRPRQSSDRYHHTFNIPVVWTVAYEAETDRPDLNEWKAQKSWLKEQSELQALLKEYDIPWQHFQWTFLPVTHQMEDGREVQAIKAIGLCTVLTVLEPLVSTKNS